MVRFELSSLVAAFTENRKARHSILKTVPRQTASRAGELVFNVLWSYVEYALGKKIYNTGLYPHGSLCAPALLFLALGPRPHLALIHFSILVTALLCSPHPPLAASCSCSCASKSLEAQAGAGSRFVSARWGTRQRADTLVGIGD